MKNRINKNIFKCGYDYLLNKNWNTNNNDPRKFYIELYGTSSGIDDVLLGLSTNVFADAISVSLNDNSNLENDGDNTGNFVSEYPQSVENIQFNFTPVEYQNTKIYKTGTAIYYKVCYSDINFDASNDIFDFNPLDFPATYPSGPNWGNIPTGLPYSGGKEDNVVFNNPSRIEFFTKNVIRQQGVNVGNQFSLNNINYIITLVSN